MSLYIQRKLIFNFYYLVKGQYINIFFFLSLITKKILKMILICLYSVKVEIRSNINLINNTKKRQLNYLLIKKLYFIFFFREIKFF
jgi:hypothetical protein